MLNFICTTCNKSFKTNSGLWKHNNNKHIKNYQKNIELNNDESIELKNNENIELIDNEKIIFACKYCYKQLSNRISKWRHENNTCKLNLNLKEKKNQLITNNITNNNIINNITNNITINYFAAPGKENIFKLNENEINEILCEGLNSSLVLIKHLNFNKNLPENHTFCTTSLHDKYLSAVNTTTCEVEKHRKIDYYDKVLLYSIAHLKILHENILDKSTHENFGSKINKIEELMYSNDDYKKIYLEQLNALSYNKKKLIQDTWNKLIYDNLLNI